MSLSEHSDTGQSLQAPDFWCVNLFLLLYSLNKTFLQQVWHLFFQSIPILYREYIPVPGLDTVGTSRDQHSLQMMNCNYKGGPHSSPLFRVLLSDGVRSRLLPQALQQKTHISQMSSWLSHVGGQLGMQDRTLT